MKPLIITILIIIAAPAFAQLEQKEQKEINAQVWRSFIQAFNEYNTTAFMAVHSKDLARVPRDSKTISTFEQYKKQMEDGDNRSKEQNIKRTIELRFIERIATSTQAFEIGIYKTTIIRSQTEPQSFYGKFIVMLRKENGIWKILLDSDSSEKNTISANDFIAAAPMD